MPVNQVSEHSFTSIEVPHANSAQLLLLNLLYFFLLVYELFICQGKVVMSDYVGTFIEQCPLVMSKVFYADALGQTPFSPNSACYLLCKRSPFSSKTSPTCSGVSLTLKERADIYTESFYGPALFVPAVYSISANAPEQTL